MCLLIITAYRKKSKLLSGHSARDSSLTISKRAIKLTLYCIFDYKGGLYKQLHFIGQKIIFL